MKEYWKSGVTKSFHELLIEYQHALRKSVTKSGYIYRFKE